MTAAPVETDRRRLLRALAEDIDDIPAPMADRMLRRWSDFTLTRAERGDAWEALIGAVDTLAAVHSGALEPWFIVPGAPPSQAVTIALETIEEDIAAALDLLMGQCPDASCDGDTHYTGRRDPGTDEDVEAGPCPLAVRR